jgi:C4-dicarboxylate-specific signal transduction histidine kinase
VTGTPRVSAAAPVRSRGRITGVLVTEFEVEEVEKAIRSFGQSDRSAMLINNRGILLSHSNPAYDYHAIEPLPATVLQDLNEHRQFLGRTFPIDPLSPEFPSTFHQVMEDGTPRTVRYGLGDLQKWGAMSRVKGLSWLVVASVPESEILRPTWAVWRKIILIGTLSSGGAFLLALLLGRLLLRPLKSFSDAIMAFGQGNSRTRLPLQTHRELEHLAQTFNSMANTIQGHQENLEALVSQRTRDLENTLAEMKTLQGMIPICSYCKKIRDDGGSWWQLESYIQKHSEAEFSHGICPDCRVQHFPSVPQELKGDSSGS